MGRDCADPPLRNGALSAAGEPVAGAPAAPAATASWAELDAQGNAVEHAGGGAVPWT